jgi:glutamate racemase
LYTQTHARDPIGVFDSGVGGLTVLKELRRALPHEDFVYFGDTARVPYGEKSKEAIVRYTQEAIAFLLQHRVKAIVIACHTASALGLESVITTTPVPLFGVVEPGVAALISEAPSGRVAVLGTASAIQSDVHRTQILARCPAFSVTTIACPLFVPIVEEGLAEHPIAVSAAELYLGGIRDVDAILLACTHYPILRQTIQMAVGPNVALIEPAKAVAAEVALSLCDSRCLNSQAGEGTIFYYASDDIEKFRRLAFKFLDRPIEHIKKAPLAGRPTTKR